MLLRGERARAYNVGSADPVTIRQLAESMVAELAPGTGDRGRTSTLPGAAGARYVPSIDGAEHELGLRVRVALPDALRRTHDFYRGI